MSIFVFGTLLLYWSTFWFHTTDCQCPIQYDCIMSPWYDWSKCGTGCTQSNRTRTRGICCLTNEKVVPDCLNRCNIAYNETFQSESCPLDPTCPIVTTSATQKPSTTVTSHVLPVKTGAAQKPSSTVTSHVLPVKTGVVQKPSSTVISSALPVTTGAAQNPSTTVISNILTVTNGWPQKRSTTRIGNISPVKSGATSTPRGRVNGRSQLRMSKPFEFTLPDRLFTVLIGSGVSLAIITSCCACCFLIAGRYRRDKSKRRKVAHLWDNDDKEDIVPAVSYEK